MTVYVHFWTLEGAPGFLPHPKAMCHVILLFLKFKSILTLLLKISSQLLITFEVLCRLFSMAYKALLRVNFTLRCAQIIELKE